MRRKQKEKATAGGTVAWRPLPDVLAEMGMPRELILALNRVGVHPHDRLRWLLAFASADLHEMSAGQRADHLWEVHAFSLGMQAQVLPGNGPGPLEDMIARWKPDFSAGEEARLEALTAIHEETRNGLAALFDGQRWSRKVNSVRFVLARNPVNGGLTQWYEAPLPDRFFFRALDLLTRFGDRIRRCADPRCNRLFLPMRRQIFCGQRHAQRVRTAAFRERNRERFRELKRKAYGRRMKRKLGKNVQTARKR